MGKSRTLTEQSELEQKVIAAIKASVEDRGFPPTRRELSALFDKSSPSWGDGIVRLLIAKGLIRMAPGSPRSISITESGMKALTEEF